MRIPLLTVRRTEAGIRADGRRPIRLPKDAAEILAPLVAGEVQEVGLVIALDGRHRAIGVCEVARGGMNVVHVAPREVFRPLLLSGAFAFIFAHNHPSGDANPSEDDRVLTARLREAGETVGVPLLDHLVLGDEGTFYSFTDGSLGRSEVAPAAIAAERSP